MKLPATITPARTDINDFSFLIYGPPKIGKTTFANGKSGKALFLATEAGLTAQDAYQIPIDSWETFREASKELRTSGHDFTRVVIDTVDNLYKFCVDWGNKTLGLAHQSDAGFGKGYDTINSEFLRELTALSLQKTGLWMLSHSKEKEIKPKVGLPYTTISSTMPEGARKIVNGMADLIMFADKRYDETDNGTVEKRVLYTQSTSLFEAGGRISFLPAIMPLDFVTFEQEFMRGLRPIQCESCGIQIAATSKMTAWQLSEYTFNHYGKRLCNKCGQAASKGKQEAK